MKGAILTRSQNAKFDHDLERLKSKYDKLYPGMAPAQIAEAKKNIPPEQIYPYPIDKPGAKWAGIFALEPRKFRHEMRVAEIEMTTLIRKISTADKTRKIHGNMS